MLRKENSFINGSCAVRFNEILLRVDGRVRGDPLPPCSQRVIDFILGKSGLKPVA